MFVDRVNVKLVAGNGGAGNASFRHEPFVPYGGPFGGDGGKGGDVIFMVDTNKSTLLDLRYNKVITATDGENGKTKKMHGADGLDTIVRVPLGTSIIDKESGHLLADLTLKDQKAIIAHGGRGGRGNFHFKTSRNPAPEYAEQGGLGEELEVKVELKLLADVGLVGYPSVGKSTLLSMVSVAKPKIADYPFTTLQPNLGVVQLKNGASFVMADLPGLVKGASLGKGLGIQFLQHIERCRVIMHLIDMSGSTGRDPLQDYEDINNELKSYKYRLSERPQVVLANMMDLPGANENLIRFKEKYPELDVYPTCTIINEGLEKPLNKVAELLTTTPLFPLEDTNEHQGVIYTYVPKEPDFTVYKLSKGKWGVQGKRIDQLFQTNPLMTEDDIRRLSHDLGKLGVEKALKDKGADRSDIIFIKDYQFTFEDF